jgi:hypothetical protein
VTASQNSKSAAGIRAFLRSSTRHSINVCRVPILGPNSPQAIFKKVSLIETIATTEGCAGYREVGFFDLRRKQTSVCAVRTNPLARGTLRVS